MVERTGADGYCAVMTPTDHDDEPRGLWPAILARSGVIFGVVGLLAWFALVWFVVGDVL